MAILNLRENEKSLLETKGDYWKGFGGSTQIRGRYEVSNQRVAFRPTTLRKEATNMVELELSDIESVKKCNIGGAFLKIIPTGVKVKTIQGEKHIFSVMKRKQFIALLERC